LSAPGSPAENASGERRWRTETPSGSSRWSSSSGGGRRATPRASGRSSGRSPASAARAAACSRGSAAAPSLSPSRRLVDFSHAPGESHRDPTRRGAVSGRAGPVRPGTRC
jgi:hypothetical protein